MSQLTNDPPSSNERKRVLVIEDELPLLKVIQKKLIISGLNVVVARSVSEGMSQLRTQPKINAIWLDHYLLGQETGLDFVSNLKMQGSPWSNIPIFVVTNTAGSETEDLYVSAGVDRIYSKAETRLDTIVADLLAVAI